MAHACCNQSTTRSTRSLPNWKRFLFGIGGMGMALFGLAMTGTDHEAWWLGLFFIASGLAGFFAAFDTSETGRRR